MHEHDGRRNKKKEFISQLKKRERKTTNRRNEKDLTHTQNTDIWKECEREQKYERIELPTGCLAECVTPRQRSRRMICETLN